MNKFRQSVNGVLVAHSPISFFRSSKTGGWFLPVTLSHKLSVEVKTFAHQKKKKFPRFLITEFFENLRIFRIKIHQTKLKIIPRK